MLKQIKITAILGLCTVMIVGGLMVAISGIENQRFYGFWGLLSAVAAFKLLGKLK